jgi:hypothetical protein
MQILRSGHQFFLYQPISLDAPNLQLPLFQVTGANGLAVAWHSLATIRDV